MTRQLLMCVKTVDGLLGESLATKGKTYTMRDRDWCARCGMDVVSVEGVEHPYRSPCIPGENWLDGRAFVPLNDPNALPEETEVKSPTPEEILEEDLAEILHEGHKSW